VAVVELYASDKTNARIFLNAPYRNLENHAPIEFIESPEQRPVVWASSCRSGETVKKSHDCRQHCVCAGI
jgi:hypothetical protein